MMGTASSTIGAFNSEKGFPSDLRLCSHDELDDIIRYVAANSPRSGIIPGDCELDDDEDPSHVHSFEEMVSQMHQKGFRLITGAEYAVELQARGERGGCAVIPLWVPINEDLMPKRSNNHRNEYDYRYHQVNQHSDCCTEEKAAYMLSTDTAADITTDSATEVDPYGRHHLEPYNPTSLSVQCDMMISEPTAGSDAAAATLTTVGAVMPYRKKFRRTAVGPSNKEEWYIRESDMPCMSSATTAEWVTVVPYREVLKPAPHFNQS